MRVASFVKMSKNVGFLAFEANSICTCGRDMDLPKNCTFFGFWHIVQQSLIIKVSITVFYLAWYSVTFLILIEFSLWFSFFWLYLSLFFLRLLCYLPFGYWEAHSQSVEKQGFSTAVERIIAEKWKQSIKGIAQLNIRQNIRK